jgi:hypothetical protein
MIAMARLDPNQVHLEELPKTMRRKIEVPWAFSGKWMVFVQKVPMY